MKTNQQSDTDTLLQEISKKLQIAHQELDEFVIQLALGKTEARDKFAEMKKNFLKRLNELNETFTTESKKSEVREKIGILESQLNTRKAEEATSFGERVVKILAALETVGKEIRGKIKDVQQQVDFDHEVEMFKLKLEILRLRFSLKKFEMKADFRTCMDEAKGKIYSIALKAKEKIKSGKERYSVFRDEVQVAYKHFRKAMETLQR